MTLSIITYVPLFQTQNCAIICRWRPENEVLIVSIYQNG